ncbi:hypothetical protein MTO96_016628 [Rhipicephalus appendiculatus]
MGLRKKMIDGVTYVARHAAAPAVGIGNTATGRRATLSTTRLSERSSDSGGALLAKEGPLWRLAPVLLLPTR